MRTANDLGNWVLAEIDGKEKRGSIDAFIANATGIALAAAGDGIDALLKLAELLGSPAAVKKAISDYKAASDAAKADKAASEKLKRDVETDLAVKRREHDLALARELKDHEAALAAGRAEMETAKSQQANLLKQAKADADKAAELKAAWQRKLSAFEAA